MAQQVIPTPAHRIDLRTVAVCDLPILFEHQCDPVANEMAAFPARDRDAFMAHWTKILADETVLARTIVLDRLVAGNIVSWEQDDKRLVGYWIGREYWGKGVATRALSAYLRMVTHRPLFAHVTNHNVASIRVLEKCGFTICPEKTRSLGELADGVEEFVYRLNASEDKLCCLQLE